MRVLGVDVGRRRIGLAVSDPTGTLARPMTTLSVNGAAEAVERVLSEVTRLQREEAGLAVIVVGAPSRLDGGETTATPYVRAFIRALRTRTSVPVVEEDERLTSREAEQRLALGERDWRKRKGKLDAVAAAVILQDYLDRRRSG